MSIISASIALAHQQHQHTNNISASAASVHQHQFISISASVWARASQTRISANEELDIILLFTCISFGIILRLYPTAFTSRFSLATSTRSPGVPLFTYYCSPILSAIGWCSVTVFCTDCMTDRGAPRGSRRPTKYNHQIHQIPILSKAACQKESQ